MPGATVRSLCGVSMRAIRTIRIIVSIDVFASFHPDEELNGITMTAH